MMVEEMEIKLTLPDGNTVVLNDKKAFISVSRRETDKKTVERVWNLEGLVDLVFKQP